MLLQLATPRTQQSLSAHEEVWDASMDGIVRSLQGLPDSRSLLVAYGDAGYVIYRSHVRHLDLVGLNDTRIAHSKNDQERLGILLNEQPDLLLLPATPLDSCYALVEQAFGATHDTRFIPVAMTSAFPYPLVYFVNLTSPRANELRRALDEQIGTQEHSTSALQPAPACLK
jgi:hypothetical protein